MYEYAVTHIEKVVDGDTIDVVIDLGFYLTIKQRVRLNGIDTPETNSKDDVEKKLGLDAKEFAAKWIASQKAFHIKTTKDDKYGRILGDLYAVGVAESLNEAMLRLGYAWSYDGGTKKKDLQLLLEKRKITSK